VDWEDLKVFLAVANAGSLAAAARRLRLSQATVWRRMRALDEALDTELFERRATGYVLTSRGAAFFRALDGVDQTISSAQRRLASGSEVAEGEVRVAAPEFLASLIAMHAAALASRYPLLHIEAVFASPLALLGVRDADISIRTEAPLIGGFYIHGAYPIAFAVYASRAYLERRGMPKSLDDLAGHDLIDFDHSITHAAPDAWRSADLSEVNISFRASSPHARLAAMRAGLGLALLPNCLIADEREVRTALSTDEIGALDLVMCVNAELRNEPRIAACAQYLDDTLRAAAR
jgi:molybdate transport repressor ModE-like protein